MEARLIMRRVLASPPLACASGLAKNFSLSGEGVWALEMPATRVRIKRNLII
jgi:hypothetical protein